MINKLSAKDLAEIIYHKKTPEEIEKHNQFIKNQENELKQLEEKRKQAQQKREALKAWKIEHKQKQEQLKNNPTDLQVILLQQPRTGKRIVQSLLDNNIASLEDLRNYVKNKSSKSLKFILGPTQIQDLSTILTERFNYQTKLIIKEHQYPKGKMREIISIWFEDDPKKITLYESELFKYIPEKSKNRIYNVLVNEHIYQPEDLRNIQGPDLLKTPNFGFKCFNDLKNAMDKVGLSFAYYYRNIPKEELDSIDQLELSVRACNAFYNAKITKISQLLRMTKEDFMKLPNFGKTSYKDVMMQLNALSPKVKEEILKE